MSGTHVVEMPVSFQGAQMTNLARAVTRGMVAGQWPKRVTFDFQTLSFIRPAGVVFLHNMIRWLHAKDCTVYLSNHRENTASLRYLRDSQFFQIHLGDEESGTSRQTTRPLIDIKHENSQSWIRLTLLPWVATRANVTKSSLYGLQNSMTEIFNNIIHHSRYDIGSVFGQHFPQANQIIIAVSDMGRGIPRTVRTVCPELSDGDAILQAVKEGFTVRSVANNTGLGLDQLLRSVVVGLGGSVTIYSGRAIVTFYRRANSIASLGQRGVGFCPGTTIEIVIDPRKIPPQSDDEEDLLW